MDIINMTVKGILGKVILEEERPYILSDFKDHLIHSRNVLKELQYDTTIDLSNHLVLSDIICLCAENLNPTDPWVTEEHVRHSLYLLEQITSGESIQAFFMMNEDTILKRSIKILQTLLLEDWKLYPGACSAFQWIFSHIRFPHMGQYIKEFLPFILRFTDDWQSSNKVRGVEMIQHLVEECAWNTELNLAIGEELIPKTLFHLLHSREVDVIDASLTTLILFYQKSRKINLIGQELLPELLNSIAITSDIYLRRVYSNYLSKVIYNSGVHVTPWLSKIVQVFQHCSTFPDPFNEKIRINIQDGLAKLLNIVEKNEMTLLFGKYVHNVLEFLIRIIYELSKKDMNEDELFISTRDNLSMISRLYKEETSILCHGMDKLSVNNIFDEVIHNSLIPS